MVRRKTSRKKKVSRRKASRRKASRRKASRRKASRRKASRRKVSRRKASRRKVSRRKVSRRKASRRKASRRSTRKGRLEYKMMGTTRMGWPRSVESAPPTAPPIQTNLNLCNSFFETNFITDFDNFTLPSSKSEYHKENIGTSTIPVMVPKWLNYNKSSFFQNEQHSYEMREMIGEGSNGAIFEYTDKNTLKNAVALKIIERTNKAATQEKSIVEKLGKVNCHIIPISQLPRPWVWAKFLYFIMPKMDNSLAALAAHEIAVPKAISLYNEIEKQILCLKDFDFFYLDLYLPQILYKCIGINNFQIYIGDMGSMVISGRTGASAYPPPRYSKDPREVLADIDTLHWVLGILALHLRGNLSEYKDKTQWYTELENSNVSGLNSSGGILHAFYWKNITKLQKNFNMQLFITSVVDMAYPPEVYETFNKKIKGYLLNSGIQFRN